MEPTVPRRGTSAVPLPGVVSAMVAGLGEAGGFIGAAVGCVFDGVRAAILTASLDECSADIDLLRDLCDMQERVAERRRHWEGRAG